MRSTSSSYSSKKGRNSGKNTKKRRPTPIRILVKCSWSGARLSPSSSSPSSSSDNFTPSMTTTVEQIISNLSLQLPSTITSSLHGNEQPQHQPSIVYMRKVVLKKDWAVTTIGHLLGDDVSCDSIMLTLNLPKDSTPTAMVTATTTSPVASAAAATTAPPSVPPSAVGQPDVIQQDSIMTPVSDAEAKKRESNVDDNDNDENIAEPMEIDDPEPAPAPAPAATTFAATASSQVPPGGLAPASFVPTTTIAPPPAATTTTATKTLSINEAIQNILSSNFDSSSTEYFKTVLKILDNILSTPTPTNDTDNAASSTATTTSLSKNIKVRTLRLTNATVQKKIIEKKHGLDLLLYVIGFEYQLPMSSSLSNDNTSIGFDFDRSSNSNTTTNNNTTSVSETIVLLPRNENKTQIQSVRDAITRVLVEQLNVPMGEIPVAPSVLQQQRQQQQPVKASSVPFDPFKAHSFNTQSAASGVPDPNSIIPGKRKEEKSTTERQLEILQEKQKNLEQTMQSKLRDRNIVAVMPGIVQGPIVTLPSSSESDFTSTTTTRGDSSLIALQMKRREEERKKREEGGFTTKAMRDLEKMKKQKVYSHVQLRVYFPDGCRLECKFLPSESIAVVKNVISSSFVPMSSLLLPSSSELQFDLYVSPPRRILVDKNTLTEEGLVPAAKIHVSWKDGHSPPMGNRPGAYLQPHLFAAASIQLQQGIGALGAGRSSAGNGSSFPESKPLTETEDSDDKKMKASGRSDNGSGNSAAGTKDTLASREEELIRRMMGKKKGGLGKGRTLGRGTNSDNSDGNNARKGGRPKWFSGEK
mmetsp:Transcript_14460/g.21899  ORF Transcript_14460/g.21899 Transcript_14460/m.21899 type:complete len:811 (+) Transcript_14460:1-2433(+)